MSTQVSASTAASGVTTADVQLALEHSRTAAQALQTLAEAASKAVENQARNTAQLVELLQRDRPGAGSPVGAEEPAPPAARSKGGKRG